jgi:hypothetical protein
VTHRRSAQRLIIAAILGLVVHFILRLLKKLVPAPEIWHDSSAHLPRLLEICVKLLARFEVQLAFVAIFAFLAASRRDQPGAWVFAFLGGMGLGYVILQ